MSFFWFIMIQAKLVISNSMWEERKQARSNINIPLHSSITHFWSLLLDATKGQTTYDDVDSENVLFHCWV